MLVAVASPSDLEMYKPGEADAADRSRPVEADGPSGPRRPRRRKVGSIAARRLPELKTRLRDGVDILYLACHGMLIDDEPRLLFEGADGKVELSGADLVAEFDRL